MSASVRQNSLLTPYQTHYSMQFDKTLMRYYHLQQKSFEEQSARLRNPHTFSQPISNSDNLQSHQTPQTFSSGSQSHLPYMSPAFDRHILPYQFLQVGPSVNLNHEPSVFNTSILRNNTDPHSMQNVSCTASHSSVQSVPSNTNGVYENSYSMHGSVSWQHPVNRQNHRVQTTNQPVAQSQQAAFTTQMNHAALTINMNQAQIGVEEHHNGTPRSVAHFPGASHMPVDSLRPSHFRTSSSQMSQSQAQNAVCQPSSYRKYTGYNELKHTSNQTSPLPHRARLNSAIQNQSNQRLNQVSPSLTQHKVQSQTTPIFGHHSKTNFLSYVAVQSSTQPQGLQSNTMSGLTTNSQDTSFSTSTSQSRSKKCTNPILRHLLLERNNSQLTGLTSSSNSFGPQSAKVKNGSHQSTSNSTAGRITTRESYTQCKKYKGLDNKTGISRGNDSHLAEPQKSSHKEMTNCEKRNEEVPPCRDPADLRMVQQVNKIVAVVTPISQQASNHRQQNDVTSSTRDSLPLKTDHFCKDRENMDKETNISNVTSKLIEDLSHIPSSPSSSPQLGTTIDTSADMSEMPMPKNCAQSCDISQCENDPVSTTQNSNKCQDAVCVVGSSSECSVEQNEDQVFESSSESATFDLSTVPVVEYTLKELKDLVNSLEVKPTERDKSTITDVVKCIIDLYYDGNLKNLKRLLSLKELFKPISEFCVKEMHTVVLQYPAPKHLNKLENCPQILINKTILPSEDFRSSWLNVDGQSADVEKVLAEPNLDYNLTWCKRVAQSVSERVENVVDCLTLINTDDAEDLHVHAHSGITKTTTDSIPDDIVHSDSEHSTAILATTDCKADMMNLEKDCVSRTTSDISMMRFSQQLHDEVDMVKENKQILTEPSLTNNSDVFEKTDISDEAECTNTPDIILLSAEDARKIFSECSEYDQKRDPHQICQDERKDLVIHCVKSQSGSDKEKPFNDFKFTCPHVTSLTCDSDFFCPSCWKETPLLGIDQNETLLTSKEGRPKTDYQSQTCSPQSGLPSAPVCPESSSIIKSTLSTTKSDGSDVLRDPKPGYHVQSSGPPPAQEPHHGVTSNKNSSITKPVEGDLQNIMPSPGTNAKHLKKIVIDSPSGTKRLTGKVSASRNLPCETVKFPNTDTVSETNGILFTPDIVIKNTNTYNQHPGDQRSTSRDEHQCRDESKESSDFPTSKVCLDQRSPKTRLSAPSQTPGISETPKCKNVVCHKKKRPIIEKKGHGGQNKETKKVRLELYGSHSRSLSRHDEKKSRSTPVYLTISPSPNAGKSYTDKASAKKKIYSRWRNTFIQPHKSFCSYKKRQKNMEDHLKSKIQTLKIALKDRLMVVS